MATRLKTVQYSFPALASLVNNTLTTLTQITLNLPENTKVFRSVVATVSFDDIITATGGSLTTKTMALRLGAAAFTTIANANTLTNSGENSSFLFGQDFTGHFTTNWTGTTMTCDFQLQINQSTGTTLGMVNVCVTLDITYEYDDATVTHIKTVMIPLNMPVGALTTGAVTYDTIPALDTYLPEASKVYRNIFVVVQGNEGRNAATTDHTITLNVGTATVTTGNYAGALASDRFFRYVWNVTATYPSTVATQTFQASATVARCNHLQAYLVVTYEFNSVTTTSVMNSLILPMGSNSPFGGTVSADYQRTERKLTIQEPATITTNRIAFFGFNSQANSMVGMNVRIGTGAFVTYTDVASVLCGSNAFMVRNDAAVTLVRGENSLNFDAYVTNLTNSGWNFSGFWLINYTSGKASAGVGAHNHSVKFSLLQKSTLASAAFFTSSAVAPTIPEADYYLTAQGVEMASNINSTAGPYGFSIQVERLTAEGWHEWMSAYVASAMSDPEVGTYYMYGNTEALFDRWPTDADPTRVNIETARRWRTFAPGGAMWVSLNQIITYHTISYSVSGNITNSAGGTVNINVCSASNGAKLMSTSRVGNGPYSLTWYDNTAQLYVEARESAALLGRSDNGVAV